MDEYSVIVVKKNCNDQRQVGAKSVAYIKSNELKLAICVYEFLFTQRQANLKTNKSSN